MKTNEKSITGPLKKYYFSHWQDVDVTVVAQNSDEAWNQARSYYNWGSMDMEFDREEDYTQEVIDRENEEERKRLDIMKDLKAAEKSIEKKYTKMGYDLAIIKQALGLVNGPVAFNNYKK
jgi:Skp family chaperone for outer membrane proteins